MPTPARRAISLEEASSPWSAKTSRAACRSSCRLRSASARSSSQPLSLPSSRFMLPILPSSGTTGPDRVHWKWIDWSTYATPSAGPSRSTTEPVDHTKTREKEYVMQSDRPKKEKTETMRAIILDDFDSSPGLRQDLPAPTPADNEVPDPTLHRHGHPQRAGSPRPAHPAATGQHASGSHLPTPRLRRDRRHVEDHHEFRPPLDPSPLPRPPRRGRERTRSERLLRHRQD